MDESLKVADSVEMEFRSVLRAEKIVCWVGGRAGGGGREYQF